MSKKTPRPAGSPDRSDRESVDPAATPIERLNAYLTRAFFDGTTEPCDEEGFEGEHRALVGLVNAFTRATRKAIESAQSAEAAMRERERQLQLVTQGSTDAIVAFDAGGKVLFANPAWIERTGLSAAELTGFPFDQVVAEDRDELRAKLKAAFQNTPFQAEYRVAARDGSQRWISASWSVLHDDAGKAIGVVGVERDETQQRESEERQRTARRLESLGRLAGGIAHDFNNLLTVVTVQVDALREHLKDDPRAQECLVPMEAAAARGADLVRQLLMFGRRTPSDRRRFDLRVPAQETVDLLLRTIGAPYAFDVALGDAPVAVAGDRSQIQQLLLNLCLNARDAMDQGGTIGVQLRVEAKPTDAKEPARARAVLEVSDHGKGIPLSDRERVFEPFFTTKPTGRGTGLGLALAHEIVQRHGGTISLSSTVGEGSVFRVSLPIADRVDEAPSESASPSGGGARRRAKVLVVEPDDEVRGVLRSSIEREGHRAYVARDAGEAESLAAGPAVGFDVLVTGLRLADGSGADLARRLAEKAAAFGVVFSTNRGGTGQNGNDVPRGARVLTKPFSNGELRDAIATALHEAEAGRRRPAQAGRHAAS